MKTRERRELKAAFIAGEYDYIVATIDSCGTGVDGLQLRANKILWVSKVPGRPALNDQALFRIFRAGITGGWDAFEQVELAIDYPARRTSRRWRHCSRSSGGTSKRCAEACAPAA